MAFLSAVAGGCGAEVADPGGGGGPPPPPGEPGLAVEVVVQGLQEPLYLTSPPGDPRLFIVEQGGRIRIVRDGQLLPTAFLDLSDLVSGGSEQGLLSMAFHPRFGENGHFYVNYTDVAGDTRVVRYTVGPDPDLADPGTAKLLLRVEQPFSNHNGGLLLFGPDGMLYVGLGDGGGAGDPRGNGQNPSTLLGSILRLDVDGGEPFAVPPDNPFVGQADRRPEIFAWGLRNPWRFAFDRLTGDLYIADVGQDRFEEVNAGGPPGANYGWNIMEGMSCFPSGNACDRTGLTLPVLEYDHGQGCSITGGFVYRGQRIPAVQGHYFYSDFCRGFLRSFRLVDGSAAETREWPVGGLGSVVSFGEDASGELYVLSASGRVFRLVPTP